MRLEAKGKLAADIIFTRHEWENYGNSMGWNSRLAEEDGKIKTAGTPSIKLVAEGDNYQVAMNYEGWRSLGKRAQFFDDDEEFYPGEASEGEAEYYSDFDIDDSEGPDLEMDALLSDIEDVEESPVGEHDAADEAMDIAAEALDTTLIGITDSSVSEHGIPSLILSALEPISEFRNIDTMGDPTEAISNYLRSEPGSEKEAAIMRQVADALKAAGIELGETLI
jgi:hypothetical protein